MRFSASSLVLALLAFAPNAFAQNIAFSMTAPSPTDLDDYGHWVTPCGDLDGDGRADLLTFYGISNNYGSVFDFDGVVAHSGANGAVLYTVPATGAGGLAGLASSHIIALDDVDADGVDDWAVTVVEHSTPQVHLRSGLDGSLIRLLANPPMASWWFGSDLTQVTDLDGDGRRDLLALDPLANRGTPSIGAAYVHSTATGAVLRTHANYSSQVYVEPGPSGDLNAFVDAISLGDADADGVEDYMVSSPRSNAGRGKLHAFSGQSGNLLYEVDGALIGPFFGIGARLRDLGDVSGDGVHDLLTSTPTGFDARSGVDGSLLYSIGGLYQQAHFLKVSQAVANWDQDAQPELFIIDTFNIYVHDGRDGSLQQVIPLSGLSSQGLWSIEAGLDINQDGLGEVAVSVRPDNQFSYPARIYVLSSIDLWGQMYCAADSPQSGCPCANFGSNYGCINSTGAGGALARLNADLGVVPPNVQLAAYLLPAGSTSVLFSTGTVLPGGASSPLGDGTLCLQGQLQRVETVSAGPTGTAIFSTGLDVATGWQPGQTRAFQVWYRDAGGPCGGGSNLTNAWQMYWIP